MLILKPDQVQYCVVTRQNNEVLEKRLGILYQAQLFTQCRSYHLEDRKEAIRWFRQRFLERDEEILSFILEEPTAWSIWYKDDLLKYAGKYNHCSSNLMLEVDLKQFVAQFRSENGIEIKDRWYNFKSYRQCFVGREAVSWMVKHLNWSHEEAVILGQRLMDEKWIHHVTHEHPFRDEYLFYQFYE